MLLEIDDEELINYSKNTDNLIRKIEEASNVLKRYNQNATQGGKPMLQKPGLNK
jgi:proteasome assembly chaperone (PAC2) family protein